MTELEYASAEWQAFLGELTDEDKEAVEEYMSEHWQPNAVTRSRVDEDIAAARRFLQAASCTG